MEEQHACSIFDVAESGLNTPAQVVQITDLTKRKSFFRKIRVKIFAGAVRQQDPDDPETDIIDLLAFRFQVIKDPGGDSFKNFRLCFDRLCVSSCQPAFKSNVKLRIGRKFNF